MPSYTSRICVHNPNDRCTTKIVIAIMNYYLMIELYYIFHSHVSSVIRMLIHGINCSTKKSKNTLTLATISFHKKTQKLNQKKANNAFNACADNVNNNLSFAEEQITNHIINNFP